MIQQTELANSHQNNLKGWKDAGLILDWVVPLLYRWWVLEVSCYKKIRKRKKWLINNLPLIYIQILLSQNNTINRLGTNWFSFEPLLWSFSQQRFWLMVGKSQALLTTLPTTLVCSYTASHDSVTLSQHAQYHNPKPVQWIQPSFIIYTCAFPSAACQNVFCRKFQFDK